MLVKNISLLQKVAEALLESYKLTEDTAITKQFDLIIDELARLTNQSRKKYIINNFIR